MSSPIGHQVQPQAHHLSAPRGPIRKKYDTFRLLGEPGYPMRYQEIWAMGAISTAKTNSLCDAVIISAEQYPGSRLLVIRDTKENARLSVWDTLLRRAKELIKSGRWVYIRDLDMIRCDNGTEIHMFGADTADNKLWGQEWFRAFVDQGEQLKQKFIQLLHTRMRQQVRHITTQELGKSYIKLTANWTEGKNWIYTRVQKNGKEVAPDFWEQKYTAQIKFQGENVTVTAFVCMILSRTEENEENTIEYMGHIVLAGEVGELAISPNWAEAKGNVFGDMREDFIINPNDPNLNKGYTWEKLADWRDKTCVMGMDWGMWHPYHIAYGQVDKKGRTVQVAEDQDSGQTIEECANRMRVQLHTFYRQGCRNFYLYYDVDMHRRETDGLRIIDKFLAYLNRGLPFAVVALPAVTHKAGSIESGASEIKTRISNQSFFVVENSCPNATVMFQQITWQDIQTDAWGIVDCFDAVRYQALNLTPFTPLFGQEEDEEPEDDEPFYSGQNWKSPLNLTKTPSEEDDFGTPPSQNEGLRTWKWSPRRR